MYQRFGYIGDWIRPSFAISLIFLSVTIPVSVCSTLHCLGSIQPTIRKPKGVRAPLFRPVKARPFLPVTRPTLSGQGAGFFPSSGPTPRPSEGSSLFRPECQRGWHTIRTVVSGQRKNFQFRLWPSQDSGPLFLGGGFTNVPESDVLAKPIL